MTDLAGRLTLDGASLLLDLDGTLVDSEPASRAAYRRYFALRGWDVPDEVLAHFMGRRATDVFATVPGPWAGGDHAAIARATLACLDHDADPPLPVPGAAELLRACRGRLPVAIVTSASRAWVERVLDILGGLDVDAIVCAEDALDGKPSPAPYLHACALLGVRPASAVACEDAPAGITAARRAGAGTVLGVTTSLPAPVLTGAGATHTSATLEVLL